MAIRKRMAVVCVNALLSPVLWCATCIAGTVFYDDFNDGDVSDWAIAPTTIGEGTIADGQVYEPALLDAREGRAWGKGSGYGYPMYTCMTKQVNIDASGEFAIQFMARSGPSWPNQMKVYLMTPSWPDRGKVYQGAGQFHGKVVEAPAEGYYIMVYGESNRWVELGCNYFADGQPQYRQLIKWNFSDPREIHNDHTYRLERDGSGTWGLYYGDAGGEGMTLAGTANDKTFTSFGYVYLNPLRDQSCVDYVRIEADSPAGSSIEGRVIVDGTPKQGLKVMLKLKGEPKQQTRTGSDGTYVFEDADTSVKGKIIIRLRGE